MIISFNNFKSFGFKNSNNKNLHSIFFQRINLLYGLNNSGKTSIIQLLKLFSYNFNNLENLKTNFKDFNMGSFENILNSRSKEKDFKIFFSQGFINKKLFRKTNNEEKTPQASIGFEYNQIGILKKIFLILVYQSEDNIYFHDYNNLKKDENVTFFEFEKDNSQNDFVLVNWKPSKKCSFFDIDTFTKEIYETRGAISKKFKNVKRFYTLAETIFEQLDIFENIFSQIIKGNNQVVLDFLQYYLDIESFDKIQKLETENKNLKIDILIKIFTKLRNRVQNQKILLENLDTFSYSNLEKTIKKSNPKSWKEQKFTTSNKIRIFILKNGLPPEQLKKLKEITNISLDNFEFIADTIDELNTLIDVISFYAENSDPSLVKEFYNAIDDVYLDESLAYYTFSNFNKNNLEILEDCISEKISKKEFKNKINKIFNDSIINSLIYDVSNNKKYKKIFGSENNLLRIFNFLDLSKSLQESSSLLSGFDTIDNIYVMNPLKELTSIDNNNCKINKRDYLLEDYNEDFINKYDENFIINKIYKDKILLSKINQDIKSLELDYELDIKSTDLNSGNTILEPVIIGQNTKNENGGKNFISTLYDAGQASKRLIPLIYHLNNTEDGILTIEEPETNIHPKYQANLANIFINTLINNNNELVIETHSELLVLRFLKLIKDKKIESDKLSIHFTNKSDHSSQIKEIRISDDGRLKDNWPDGFFKERLKELL